MRERDGHIRVLPLHVANKIAAGEVVERPASVVKELVENALDAGAKSIRIAIAQGGRKLVAVQDDGCGMTRDDAVLCLERQATSKILDVNDIEEIDTLGFRGEAIPSIASISRFTLVTRRHDADEGTRVEVNAGALADVCAAGCPAGTRVEVRDLFCNVPARRKFLRAYATEEGHVKNVFTVHALAHPAVAFSLTVDGRELYRLAPAKTPEARIRDLFGKAFAETLLPVDAPGDLVSVTGYIERPNLQFPTRREQYVFVNGRPATAPAVQYALREAYPRRQGDARPAAILFLSLPPKDVDVNVHPTKREIRFRNNAAVRTALMDAIAAALGGTAGSSEPAGEGLKVKGERLETIAHEAHPTPIISPTQPGLPPSPSSSSPTNPSPLTLRPSPPTTSPSPFTFRLSPSKPWVYFRVLAVTEVGYVLLETDAGVVTLNPSAARERIVFEKLARRGDAEVAVQDLLLPETVQLPPADFHRLSAALDAIRLTGFRLEPFGKDTFKVEAVPQLIGALSCADILTTIAADLAAPASSSRSGAKWREDLIAKSVARSYAGHAGPLDAASATRLVEELVACQIPYVTPNGKSVMIFTSFRELDRKFGRD